jgi:hypothetical protein
MTDQAEATLLAAFALAHSNSVKDLSGKGAFRYHELRWCSVKRLFVACIGLVLLLTGGGLVVCWHRWRCEQGGLPLIKSGICWDKPRCWGGVIWGWHGGVRKAVSGSVPQCSTCFHSVDVKIKRFLSRGALAWTMTLR